MNPFTLLYATLDMQYRAAVMCGAWWLYAWSPGSYTSASNVVPLRRKEA